MFLFIFKNCIFDSYETEGHKNEHLTSIASTGLGSGDLEAPDFLALCGMTVWAVK